jgi:osmotically-inducible protein OsmY
MLMTTTATPFKVVACASLIAFASSFANAQQAAPNVPASSTSADNTGINQRDRAAGTMKPTDQPNDSADIKVAAAVRRAIMRDKSLSTKAHNVKLVASTGVVTLRGPVASSDEKAKVEEIAAKVAGVDRVDNQLDVKTN